MKKQITFLIIWDVVFYIFLFVFSSINNLAQHSYYRAENPFLFIIISSIMWVLAGILICWLVLVTGKYECTRKTAALEFIIVGGFAFYFASFFIAYFMLPSLIDGFRPIPRWILLDRNTTAVTLGGILFGYELLMFIVRMLKCGRKET